MISWSTQDQFERFIQRARQFGLDVAKPKYHYFSRLDCFALVPFKDCLPVYTRDAELFVGNLSQAESWLAGMEWARNYYLRKKAFPDL